MPKNLSQLSDFDEADAALRILGQAQRKIALLEHACQAHIDDAKKKLAEARIGADAEVKVTKRLLTAFIKRRKKEIEARGGKTIRLTFGRIGMRTPPPALCIEKGRSEDDVIARIRMVLASPEDYIQRTERLKREELKLLEDVDLSDLGLYIN